MSRNTDKAPRWPTLDTVWAALVPLGLLIILNMHQVHPADFWWHLKTGEIIVTERRIPTTDEYTFTRSGQSWVNQAWGMQAVLFLLHRAGGIPVIILAHALTLALGYSVLARAAALQSNRRLAVLATLVGAAVGFRNSAIRPQSFSFLAFGLLIYLIEKHRQGRRGWMWGAPLLFAIWVNAHGGFVFGGALLAVYVLGRLWESARRGWPASERRAVIELVTVGAASFLALSLNPQGLGGMIRYVLGFWESKVTFARNLEFTPLTIRESDGLLFFASLVLLMVLLRQPDFRLRTDHVLGLLLFGVLALVARRNAAWYGFVVTPILAAGLHARWGYALGAWPGIRWANITVLALLIAGVGVTLPWGRQRLPLPADRRELIATTTPVRAMEFLCDRAPDHARSYQHQVFGSYQIWACPKLPVFIDTRIELYSSDFWEEYFAIELGRYDWEKVVEKHKITYLMLSRRYQTAAIQAASESPRWREIYRDDRAVIFEKREAIGPLAFRLSQEPTPPVIISVAARESGDRSGSR